MAGGSNEPPDLKREKIYSVFYFILFFCFDPLKYKLEHPDPKRRRRR